jgi:TolB-like protein/Tfp pilus assembly protein PilF
VLPFENLSEEKENAYLADGVQDDVLTDLTKVADLKVISRRSVAQYRDTKQSIREIGKALQVAHVLEGTVRKVADRIHVTAQLIDTRNETQIWAEKYDRDIADVFQIQNEISQAIVTQLKAALSPAEKAAIEEKPTEDKEAYDLYLRAHALIYEHASVVLKEQEENAMKAIPLLESAIARDPKFTLAYCVLGDARLTVDENEKAKDALDTALRISPNSAEAHLILARYFFGTGDASTAEKEVSLAAAGLPGRVDVFNVRADVEERQGKWKEALRDREKAAELDPRDVQTADSLAILYICLRRYETAERLVDHMIAITPQQTVALFWRRKSNIALAKGDAKAAMAAFDASPLRKSGLWGLNHAIANVFVMERDYAKAEEILQSVEETAKAHNALPKILPGGDEYFGRGLSLEHLGRIARFRAEKEKARGYFEAARARFEEFCVRAADEGRQHQRELAKPPAQSTSLVLGRGLHALGYIAEIDAGLGRKEDAIREARNAIELCPLKRDAMVAPQIATFLAIVYLWTGERDAALQQLADVAKLPGPGPLILAWCPAGLSAGELKLDPLWDELRNDPRFDKIVAEAAKPIKID